MNDIYKLQEQVQQMGGLSAAYWDKMMHPVPSAEVVDRELFLLERTKDKVVLDIGGTGQMGEAISMVAMDYYCLDTVDKPDHVDDARYYKGNLDYIKQIPGS